MATHEIPASEWKSFLQTFSERRKGAKVTVEVTDPKQGPRREIGGLALVGITYEGEGSGAGTIELLLGDDPSAHVTHTVTHPKAIYHKGGAGVLSEEVNPDEIIEITSADEPPIVQLHFADTK